MIISKGMVVTGKILLAAVIVLLLMGLTMLLDGVVMMITKKNFYFFSSSPYVQMAAFIGGTLIMFALFDRRKGWSLGLRQTNRLRSFWKGMLLGIASISVVAAGIAALGGIRVTAVTLDANIWLHVLSSLFFFLLVAINEELLVRGYIQGLFRHHYGAKTAVIAASLLFALLHGGNAGVWDSPVPMLNIWLAGVVLSLGREVSGGLWLPVGFHLTWNFFQGDLYGFHVSGNETDSVLSIRQLSSDVLSGGAFGAEGSIVATLVMLACCFVIYRKRRMFSPAEPSQAPLSVTIHQQEKA